MSDPKQRLTPAEVEAAGLADWRQVFDTIRARFRTGDFATGLALVNRIGEAAEAADHHPEVTLSYPEVLVALNSHDVRGITSRDIDLARQISAYTAELGAAADVAGLTQVELGLDTSRSEANAAIYAALLGGKVDEDMVRDPSGQVPTIWWQQPGEEDEWSLPPTEVPQRWHLDVWVPADEAPARLAAVIEAGGRLVSDVAAPAYWVIEDADGNRSCLCTSSDREP